MDKNHGLSFVTLVIIIAVLSLMLRVGIDAVLKINIAQNESTAQATLKLITTAADNYAKDHLGSYPMDLSLLSSAKPSYLDMDYAAHSPIKGYRYMYSIVDATGYTCSARPEKCGITGRHIFTSANGSSVQEKECSANE